MSSTTQKDEPGRAAKKMRVDSNIPAGKPAISRDGWNGLDPNILHDVLTRMNLRDKVKCASRICKAWNEMKDRADLFKDLTDESGPDVDDMETLLKWLPSCTVANVTGIRMSGDISNNSDAAMACLVPAKIIAKPRRFEDSLSDIEKMVFEGLSADTLISGCRERGVGPSLKLLTLNDLPRAGAIASYSRLNPNDASFFRTSFVKFFRKCALLETLKMPALLLSPRGLTHSLSAIGPAEVTPTALRVLDLTMSISGPSANPLKGEDFGTATWSDLRDLGTYCPNLEVVKLPTVVRGQESFSLRDGDMVLMPQLRVCSIDRLVPVQSSRFISYKTNAVSNLVLWLLRGMPSVEEFTFGHGGHESLHPFISYGFDQLPQSLRKLHLTGFFISPLAFSTSAVVLDMVESITFEECSGDPLNCLHKLKHGGKGAVISQDGNTVRLIKGARATGSE